MTSDSSDSSKKRQPEATLAGAVIDFPQDNPPTPSTNGSPDVVLSNLPKKLFDRADKLETKLLVASDNGLFRDQTSVTFERILDELAKVFPICMQSSVSGDDYSNAIKILDKAESLYDTAIISVKRRNSFVYVYAFPTLAYLMIILGLIASETLWRFPVNLANSVPFLAVPKKIFAAGAVGALLQDLWYLWQRVSNREYRKIWTTLYALSPVLGALLGAVVYLAFLSGILVSTTNSTFSNLTLPILLAIVAGYNWRWAIDIMENIAKAFSVKQDTSK